MEGFQTGNKNCSLLSQWEDVELKLSIYKIELKIGMKAYLMNREEIGSGMWRYFLQARESNRVNYGC